MRARVGPDPAVDRPSYRRARAKSGRPGPRGPAKSGEGRPGPARGQSTWFPTRNDKFIPPVGHSDAPKNGHDNIDSDYESDLDEELEPAGPVAVELQEAMDQIENLNLSFTVEDKVNTLSYAAIALTVNDSLEM